MLSNQIFENVNRITLLAAVLADGDLGPPMFVFQGTRLRVGRITRSGGNEENSEFISELLPHGLRVTARKDIVSVDRANFMKWAEQFLKQTEKKRSTGKILLIYEGYRSHLDIQIWEMLAKSTFIAYALPAHTSGTTQPLDVAIFPSLNYHYRARLEKVYRSRCRARKPMNDFDVSQIISKAYTLSLTNYNINSRLSRCGIYPFDECSLFSQARPYIVEETYRLASVEEMVDMMDKENDRSIEDFINYVHVHSSGFLDITYCAVLKSDVALGLLKLQDLRKKQQRNVKDVKEAEEARMVSVEKEKWRVVRLKFDHLAAVRRVTPYGDRYQVPRPLSVRRAIAKSNTAKRHST
ncbi:hypothetical protein BWQ96_07272 [Gracilariopsis chorda]|uniref:DDE-1 domain-containing protein n=1 Tax=Gracilariopsis chorda TaxID=448386 RepID=A0A2V3ILQ8_9FLOR|nr:hypothetical protein BWQ96_07272 [Gracilariopsis chorda]|eukprot:PXF43024.1 hypothetical protein BWQ96_07272 [Gracilariopsis chorda]